MDPDRTSQDVSATLTDESLATIRRLAARLGRRRLPPAEVEDFVSFVVLRLVDRERTPLRRFRQEARMSTFLFVVLQRLLSDYCNQLWGKWRPSAAARRAGEVGVVFERLLRDGAEVPSALCELRQRRLLEGSSRKLRDLARNVAIRRVERVDALAQGFEPAWTGSAAERVEAAETKALRDRILLIVRACLQTLEPEDRQLLQMRFVEGLPIAEIARRQDVPAAPLYRRVERSLAAVREAAVVRGLRAADIIGVLGVDSLEVPSPRP